MTNYDFETAYEQGYREGFEEGREEGHENGREAGLETGYEEGVEHMRDEVLCFLRTIMAEQGEDADTLNMVVNMEALVYEIEDLY
jgi:flagellar biosynthesis/type III secretory pathway protein FliH